MKNADMPINPMFNEHGCPQHHSSVLLQEGQVNGLTKRELFAAMAMQGLAARLDMTSEDRAIYAVECADDLLAALEALP